MKNEIIDKLMEIEEEAKLLNESVLRKQDDNPIKINQKCVDIEKKAEENFNTNFDIAIKKIQRDSSLKIEKIKAEKTDKIENINNSFDKDHQLWEEDIFNNIIRW